MVDTCTVRRETGTATDDFSGETVTTYMPLYDGPCEVKQVQALPETHEAGEDYVVLSRLQLKLPTSATGLQVGDEVVMNTSAHDPDLPGRVLLIRGPAKGSHITARRFEVTERTG
jgi:hypothetical protein